MSHNLTVFYTTESFKQWRKKNSYPLGFVPTMGNLHLGHISLLEMAIKKYSQVVLSIFVNPTQFGPSEDFEKYPRTLEQDILLVELMLKNYPDAQVIVYAPQHPSEIYHKDFSSFISPGKIGTILEGEKRPGHFQGVCSVVSILLHIVQPECLFLGKKDYQQWKILQKMITDLHFPVSIIAGETVRNFEGLALSSRNRYLSSQQLELALNFPKQLHQIKSLLVEEWEKNHCWKVDAISSTIATFCQNSILQWDYCTLRQQDLEDVSEGSREVVLLAVIRIENLRLLDNMEISLAL